MEIEQLYWDKNSGWHGSPCNLGDSAQLVLLFGNSRVLVDGDVLDELKGWYPAAILMGCSTAGEIHGIQVLDDSLTVAAIRFDHTLLKLARARVEQGDDSRNAGRELAQALDHLELCYVLVLSDGLHVNGSALIGGLREELSGDTLITGGLAGDGGRFQSTLLCADGLPAEKIVAALGFYGDRLKVGYGSQGGWDPFGPERLITKAQGNVLYELDGRSALGLYKQYLGEHATGLPATALRFPLELRIGRGDHRLVRTVLGIDEAQQSMIFAGDMPEGSYARLMKANFDRIIGGAISAAKACALECNGTEPAEFALLISCVGRKLILQQLTEEEVEVVRDVLGPQARLIGFYSYGEFCPAASGSGCELHNQTMTITTFREV